MLSLAILEHFRGRGVRPPEEKRITAGKPSRRLPAPDKVYLSLLQHAGTPCTPTVRKGDRVIRGQVVGEPSGLGAPVHSPICGRVVAVEPYPHPSGQLVPTVIIENDGGDSFLPLDRSYLGDTSMPEAMDPAGIRRLALEAGLVGLGGGLFPTHIKLTPRSDPRPDLLILNGCECEPYLTCDHRLMVEEPHLVLWGARAMRRALGVNNVVIAIEDNKPDAIELISHMIRELPGFSLRVLPSRYPQGAERTLTRTLTGRQVPSCGLPADVGVVVHNVGTAAALGRALLHSEPLLERIVTVAGDAVREPGNFWVAIGTPIGEVLRQAGLKEAPVRKVIMGGPMMGLATSSLELPILKGCSGLLAFTAEQETLAESLPCVRCGRCLEVCPQGLAPVRLTQLVAAGMVTEAATNGLLDCVECGACAYICPSRRPLVQYLRQGKAELRRRQAQQPAGQPTKQPVCRDQVSA
ncbi:MAG: electron transport complex subunit RsxC [Limnochordales bacterium]|nr:electron transport complex subunit RsxC [Limnochordales bacterium]